MKWMRTKTGLSIVIREANVWKPDLKENGVVGNVHSEVSVDRDACGLRTVDFPGNCCAVKDVRTHGVIPRLFLKLVWDSSFDSPTSRP